MHGDDNLHRHTIRDLTAIECDKVSGGGEGFHLPPPVFPVRRPPGGGPISAPPPSGGGSSGGGVGGSGPPLPQPLPGPIFQP